jgi:hypothetical protein
MYIVVSWFCDTLQSCRRITDSEELAVCDFKDESSFFSETLVSIYKNK